MQSQTSCQNLDEILRRAKLRVSPEQAGSESRGQINPSGLNADNFAQQSAHFSGRSPIQAFVGGNAGIPIVQSSTGTLTLTPTAPVTMTL